MKYILLFPFLLYFSLNSFGQSFSNKGKDFWVGYGYHVRMDHSANSNSNPINGQDMVLYFATDQVTHITVSIPGIGYSQSYVSGATPGVLTSAPIPKSGTQDARLKTESQAPENKGIHITSDYPIVAYAHIYNTSVSGATILFPTNTLGKTYYSINFKNYSNEQNSNAWFYVIAADTGITTVKITPSAATINHPANIPFTVNLTQGQVFNVMGQMTNNSTSPYIGVDLTGSKIESIASGTGNCKRIAVFSGSGKINISCYAGDNSSADNYIVQAFPKDAWGKKFLTVPTMSLHNNIYRICVSDPSTIVNVNGSPISSTLINNFYYQIDQTTDPLLIESNQPITVAQYITTQGACGNPTCDQQQGNCLNPGDPEVIYLSPVEQNISKVLWNATPNYNITQHYFNVVIPNNGVSSFTLDGASLSDMFLPHPQDPNYSYLSMRLSSSGTHIIESDSGFNAIAYGFGQAESYGYNAGTNIKDLYNVLTPINPNATSPNFQICTGTPFYFKVSFPFKPTSLLFDFGGLIPTENYPTQASVDSIFDTTFILGGKTIWQYRLPHNIVYNVSNTAPGNIVNITAGTTSTDGCGNSFDKEFYIQIFDPPTADFNWEIHSGCITDSFHFNDHTFYESGLSPQKWFWDFGDGKIDSISNPVHKYTNPGTYWVKFHILTNLGCTSDTIVKKIIVSNVPISNYNISTPVCNGSQISFTNTSTMSLPDTIKKFYWDFGDNNRDTFSYPNNAFVQHTFNTVGNYIVTLQLETNSGCKNIPKAFNLFVGQHPKSGFVNPDFCLLDPYAQFQDTSLFDPRDPITKWIWNFDDRLSGVLDTSLLRNPIHAYSSIGTKNVQLIVTTNNGCKDTVIQSFYVSSSKPIPGINVLNSLPLCTNDSIVIQNTSIVNLGVLYKSKIFWDDSRNANIINIDNTPQVGELYAHLYPNPHQIDSFTIKLIVSSGGSCLDSISTKIILHPSPEAKFKMDKRYSCLGDVLSFTDLSLSGTDGSINKWKWYWGNGDSSSFQYPKYIFSDSGIFRIKLLSYSTNGCVSKPFLDSVFVYPYPMVDAGSDKYVLEGSSEMLDATVNGNILSLEWKDQMFLNNAHILNPICTPVGVDTVFYKLRVIGLGNCSKEDNVKVVVLKTPLIPNTFTPNNDGYFDLWDIKFLEQYQHSRVQVFTRSGQLVYECTGPYKKWDGKKNGVDLPMDTYYYIIEPESGRRPITGYVTIVR